MRSLVTESALGDQAQAARFSQASSVPRAPQGSAVAPKGKAVAKWFAATTQAPAYQVRPRGKARRREEWTRRFHPVLKILFLRFSENHVRDFVYSLRKWSHFRACL